MSTDGLSSISCTIQFVFTPFSSSMTSTTIYPSPIPSHSSNHSNHSAPWALVGSFHNPIVVDDDNSDNDTALPVDNTWCSQCQRYIYNSFHSEDYCDTIFVPGAPTMVCRQCGLHGHLMLDCREIVCSWCVLSSEFGRRYRVQSRARRWLQLVGCAALLLDASNFGGPDGVGESGVEPRRSLRRRERVKEK